MQSDDLEKVLQEGLQNYSEAEPLAGLEERVLRGVQQRRLGSRRRWLGGAAAAAFACLVLAVLFGLARDWRKQPGSAQLTMAEALRNRPPLVDLPRAAEKTAPHVSNGIAPHRPVRQTVAADGGSVLVPREGKPRVNELPRLNMFPTPHPLTPEERALVEFVNQHPKEAAQLVDAERRSSEPIQISAIHIEPLKIDGPEQEREKNAEDY